MVSVQVPSLPRPCRPEVPLPFPRNSLRSLLHRASSLRRHCQAPPSSTMPLLLLMSPQPTAITSAVRSLTALNRCAGHVHFAMHTPSHSGNPGNELADSLTKLAHHRSDKSQQHALEQLIAAPELAWLWVLYDGARSLPYLDQHGFAEPQASTCFRSQAQTPAQAAYQCNPPAAAPQAVQMRCATYNTLSLKSRLQQQTLATLFRHHACSVVGLQETRLADTQLHKFGAFTAYTAPSTEGQGGCQLWVNFGRHLPEW